MPFTLFGDEKIENDIFLEHSKFRNFEISKFVSSPIPGKHTVKHLVDALKFSKNFITTLLVIGLFAAGRRAPSLHLLVLLHSIKELFNVLLPHHLLTAGKLGKVLHQVVFHRVVRMDGLHLRFPVFHHVIVVGLI